MCLIYIVNTYPVECAELSYSCWLGMAYWLRFLFLARVLHILKACIR